MTIKDSLLHMLLKIVIYVPSVERLTERHKLEACRWQVFEKTYTYLATTLALQTT